MLNGLSLFSGIGGIDIALNEWVRTIAYCEIDPYCQAVLLSRMADESLCSGPIWNDITSLDGTIFKGAIDIIHGGFPCQDISVAGAGKGLAGERSGLFYQIVRLCREIEPRFIFLENVPAITSRDGAEVVREIAKMGYGCRWCVISAASVGALHRRERWFFMAYAEHHGSFTGPNWRGLRKCSLSGKGAQMQKEGIRETERTGGILPNVADFCNSDGEPSEQADKKAESKPCRWPTWGRPTGQYWPFESREHWQETVSCMGKCIDGVSAKLDNNTQRLKALGNAVVPIQVKEAFKILMGL